MTNNVMISYRHNAYSKGGLAVEYTSDTSANTTTYFEQCVSIDRSKYEL